MPTYHIHLDDESAQTLLRLAREWDGDPSLVVRELLRPHRYTEAELDSIEGQQADEIKRQLEGSRRSFAEGTAATIEQMTHQRKP